MINIGVVITATAECADLVEIALETENLGYKSFGLYL